MCGIVGFSGKRKSNPDKLALLMLHNSLKRGEDDTGIYSIETGVVKKEKKAEEFLGTTQLPRTNLFIGHVRKASVGSKVEKNAHPVEYDNLILVHNGTLNNHQAMCREAGYDWFKDFDTDTQVLAKLLDDDSKKERIVFSTLSEYLGFAALLFTDKRDPTVLMAYRNNDRPLFHGFCEGGMYISSMKENLMIIGCTDIEEFPPFFVHTIKNGVIINSIFYREKEKPVYTNGYNSYNYNTPNITNVKWKNKATGDILSHLKETDSTRIEVLVDKWVRCVSDMDSPYGPKENIVKITKNKWYLVDDSSVDNGYDIQLLDDRDNLVWVSFYMFDTKYIDYPSGYGYSMSNIFEENNATKLLYAKGTIIKLAERAIIDKDNRIGCMYNTDEVMDIPVSLLRPALKDEVDAHLASNAEELNKILQVNSKQSAINFDKNPVDNGTSELSNAMSANGNEPKEPVEEASPFREVGDVVVWEELGKVKKSEDLSIISVETEVIPNEDDDETIVVVHAILDVIDSKVDDLNDLLTHVDWAEVKTIGQELKDIVNEAYNVDGVRSTIAKN